MHTYIYTYTGIETHLHRDTYMQARQHDSSSHSPHVATLSPPFVYMHIYMYLFIYIYIDIYINEIKTLEDRDILMRSRQTQSYSCIYVIFHI